jgi:hypothetical protein
VPKEAENAMDAYCPKCGRERDRDSTLRFCGQCGYEFQEQAQQAQSNTPPAPKPPRKSGRPAPSRHARAPTGPAEWGPLGRIAVTGIVVVFGVGLVIAILGGNPDGGGEEEEDPASTNIVGEFLYWEPVDEERGYAYIRVTNHGSTRATAECTVSVENDFGDFGFDYMVGESIGPGESFEGRMAINVGSGSFTIDSGEVTDC